MLAKLREEKAAALRAQGIFEKKETKEDDDEDAINILRKPEDIRDDPHYGGETEVLLKYVPLKCIDEKTRVDEDTLREWIIYGIVEEDPYAEQYFDHIERLNERLADIDKQLKRVPKIEFRDEGGKPLSEEKARVEREALFTRFNEERAMADRELEDVNNELKNHIEWRKKMGVHLKQTEIDKVTDTSTWIMTLSGTTDVQNIEDLLLKKENWPGIKVAAGKKTGEKRFPPWTGRGPIPDGNNLTLPDYTYYQVNMIGVRILRVPKGVGVYRTLDRKSSGLAAEEFSVFYGEYENGLKNGHGIEISDLGVYTGGFEEGVKRGRGRYDLADGTTIIGTFGCQRINKLPDTLAFKNPYLEGEAHGQVEIYFSDGAYFRGQMTNGIITGGQGDYQSAMDEIQSGHFEHGLLHGERGYMKTCCGEEYFGQFSHGQLHGLGTYLDRYGDSYDGYWENHLKHGRGISKFHQTGCYRGYFLFGQKHGKGSLEYGKKPSKREKEKEQNNAEKRKKDKEKQKLLEREREKARLRAANRTQKETEQNGEPGSPQKTKDSDAKSKTVEEETEDNAEDDDEELDDGEKEITMTKHLDNYELSPFDNIYQGYFMANSITNLGSVMNTTKQVQTLVARNNKRSIYPITKVLLRESRISKEHHRKRERLKETESFMRLEIAKKKSKIFRQQKHYTKKMMYDEEMKNKFNYRELASKFTIREERLKSWTEDRHLYQKALIPRLQAMNKKPMTMYRDAFKRLEDIIEESQLEADTPGGFVSKKFRKKKEQAELLDPSVALAGGGVGDDMSAGSGSSKSMRFSDMLSLPSNSSSKKSGRNDPTAVNYINKKLLSVVLSDFEEIRERQRFLKYDLIWQRAENAYSQTKKTVNDA